MQPRDLQHYLYLPTHSTAQGVAHVVTAEGFGVEVRDPLPHSTDYLVLAERRSVVLTVAEITAARALFERLAAEHQGEYEGWEASA